MMDEDEVDTDSFIVFLNRSGGTTKKGQRLLRFLLMQSLYNAT